MYMKIESWLEWSEINQYFDSDKPWRESYTRFELLLSSFLKNKPENIYYTSIYTQYIKKNQYLDSSDQGTSQSISR
jgi:hypothetical protein